MPDEYPKEFDALAVYLAKHERGYTAAQKVRILARIADASAISLGMGSAARREALCGVDVCAEFLAHLTGVEEEPLVPPGSTEAQRRMTLGTMILRRACEMATERTYELAADGHALTLQAEREMFEAECETIEALLADTRIRFRTIPTSLKAPKP